MAAEPLKLVWADRQLEYELTNQRFKIGRGAHNEIQIPDQLVSSNHAILHNGVLSDKGSTNGTFVNGEALQKTEKRQLKPGDVIMFGDTKFTVERGSAHAARPAAPGDDSPSSSDEEDNNKKRTDTMKKAPEESPIAWHPVLPSNGTQEKPKPRVPVKPAYNTGLSKANSKERKLEEEIDKLKHQLYYGDREEKMATGQLMVARQEIEALKKQLSEKNTQISSWSERYQKLEMKEKAYDDQVQYLMKQLTKVEARQAEQASQGNREEPQAKLLREQTEAALKQDREQAALIYKKILANQVALTQRMDESSARMSRTLLFLNLIVLLLAVLFIASNFQHIQTFANSFLQHRG